MINILLIQALVVFTSIDTAQPAWFKWLVGTWVDEKSGGKHRLEVWTMTDKNTLAGKGLKLTGGDTILLENIELAITGDQIQYIPAVPDQNEGLPVYFNMVKDEGNVIVFENAAHDFPQRIVYKCKPLEQDFLKGHTGDSLFVRVETLIGEGINFRFRRK